MDSNDLLMLLMMVDDDNKVKPQPTKKQRRKQLVDEILEQQRIERLREKYYPEGVFKVQFPHPIKAPIEDIEEFLANECRVSVLKEYLRMSKEDFSTTPLVLHVIEARLAECISLYANG